MKRTPLISWTDSRGDKGAEKLVLLFHGMDCGPQTMSSIADKLLEANPSSYILIPALPFRWDDSADLKEVAEEVLDYLDKCDRLQDFRSILFIGHSAGGVLAQATYILSRDAHKLSKFPVESIRLVLIAPLSRGWQISHHLPLTNKIAWKLGRMFVPLVKAKEKLKSIAQGRRAQPPWILQLQRGAPFLVWMRLAWLKLKERPQLVVLLGSVDEIISWRDMVDEVVGSEAVHLQVPYSDHARIIDFEDKKYGQKRADSIIAAATEDLAELGQRPESIVPWDENPACPNPEVKRVVFVIHGIRDEGHWTQKIGAQARSLYGEAGLKSRDQIRVVTSSYGYFSMLEFLLAKRRLLKIHWLMDQYVEARRRFPEAKFSFVGHSNGTYLLAQALKLYPEVEFERVAFAGSVVSTKFDWRSVSGQVSYVQNFTATKDWVVALFPRISELLPGSLPFGPNIGGAGIEPFRHNTGKPPVKNEGYVEGAHSAAIQEENWSNLALFAVQKVVDQVTSPQSSSGKSGYAKLPRWYFGKVTGKLVALALWFLLIPALLGYLGWLAWTNPMLFWGPPALLAVLCVVLIALNQGRRVGVSFSRRREIDAVSGWIVLFLGASLAVGFVWSIVLVCTGRWENHAREAVRTISVVVYLIMVYKALTKV